LYGTLVVGAIDLIDAIVFFGLRGVRPIRIFNTSLSPAPAEEFAESGETVAE